MSNLFPLTKQKLTPTVPDIRNGYGVHIWDLHLDKLTPFKQYDLVEEDIYALGVWFVKTAILVFYLRLSPEKRFRQITYGIIAFVAVYTLISLLVFTLPCRPIAAAWDVTLMAEAKCISQFDFVYANAAFNILSDLMALVLPIRLCWNLQAPFKQKVLLMFLFVMGSLYALLSLLKDSSESSRPVANQDRSSPTARVSSPSSES